MNSTDLQALAEARVREASALIAASLPAGAYYLAGYAVECALKACIAKQTREFDFPDRNLVNKAYTRKLRDLVSVAGLSQELEEKLGSDAGFAANWLTVKDWSEEARYQPHTEKEARDLFDAIIDRRKGVLTWLRDHW